MHDEQMIPACPIYQPGHTVIGGTPLPDELHTPETCLHLRERHPYLGNRRIDIAGLLALVRVMRVSPLALFPGAFRGLLLTLGKGMPGRFAHPLFLRRDGMPVRFGLCVLATLIFPSSELSLVPRSFFAVVYRKKGIAACLHLYRPAFVAATRA